MEFNEKLQELRKQRGLTQEELAKSLFVSRTAVSKWESGRGYPSIESLKLIARFFSLTVDELISSDEILTIAEENQAKSRVRTCDLIFGLLDACMCLLLFLPLFSTRAGGQIQECSLLSLFGVASYLRVLYFIGVIGTSVVGILTLAFQGFSFTLWTKFKVIISLALGTITALLFIISLQPYASAFAFSLLIIKASVLIFSKERLS